MVSPAHAGCPGWHLLPMRSHHELHPSLQTRCAGPFTLLREIKHNTLSFTIPSIQPHILDGSDGFLQVPCKALSLWTRQEWSCSVTKSLKQHTTHSHPWKRMGFHSHGTHLHSALGQSFPRAPSWHPRALSPAGPYGHVPGTDTSQGQQQQGPAGKGHVAPSPWG